MATHVATKGFDSCRYTAEEYQHEKYDSLCPHTHDAWERCEGCLVFNPGSHKGPERISSLLPIPGEGY